LKRGQNTNHEKSFFQSGIDGKISSQELTNLVKGWGDNSVHKKAKNISRKKNKRK
jgi:hypothetical protein